MAPSSMAERPKSAMKAPAPQVPPPGLPPSKTMLLNGEEDELAMLSLAAMCEHCTCLSLFHGLGQREGSMHATLTISADIAHHLSAQ